MDTANGVSMSHNHNNSHWTAPQIYGLATRARGKFMKEASRPDRYLRRMVAHANMLDTLMERLAIMKRQCDSVSDSSDGGEYDEALEFDEDEVTDDSDEEEVVETGIVSIRAEDEAEWMKPNETVVGYPEAQIDDALHFVDFDS